MLAINELIFVAHIAAIGACILTALYMGKEALVAAICTQCLLANLFVTKQITLLGFNATSSDAFSVGAALTLSVLQEYYGRREAQRAIAISFFILLFYVGMSLIQLAYVPDAFDGAHPHFVALLNPMPRIITASLIVYGLVQILESYWYAFLKNLFQGRYVALRTALSVVTMQLLDTVLFSFLGLYGIMHNISEIIIISYGVKVCAVVLASPFVSLTRALGRRVN